MQQSFQDIAQRMVNAKEQFIENIQNAGTISEEQAISVADFYIKNKIVKLNLSISRYEVKHGAFYEKNTIRRALKEIDA